MSYIAAMTALWLLSTLVGGGFGVLALLRYAEGRRAVPRVQPPEDRPYAAGLVRNYLVAESVRLTNHTISLAILLAHDTRIVVAGLVAINVLTTVNSVRAWRTRDERRALHPH
jgi:hypothetical protein